MLDLALEPKWPQVKISPTDPLLSLPKALWTLSKDPVDLGSLAVEHRYDRYAMFYL